MRSRSRGRPLPPRRLVLVWALSAAMLAAGIVVEQATQGPLDDPRQARQRPGLLIAAGAAPSVTMEVTDGIPAPGRPAVLLFVRDDQYGQLIHALTSEGQGQAFTNMKPAPDLVIVRPTRPDNPLVPAPIAFDPSGQIARTYHMPVPRDGGPPVGYAIFDAAGRLRYATLDPGLAGRLREVRTMVGALQ